MLSHYMYTLCVSFILSSIKGYFGFFQPLAIGNDSAVNMELCITQPWKWGLCPVCSMEELWGQHDKWDRLVSGQTLSSFPQVGYSTQSNSPEQTLEWMLPAGGGTNYCPRAMKFQHQRESLLEIHQTAKCQWLTVWMCTHVWRTQISYCVLHHREKA